MGITAFSSRILLDVHLLVLLLLSFGSTAFIPKLVTDQSYIKLHEAIKRNEVAVVDGLLGGDSLYVDAKNSTGWAPLHVAAFYGSVDVVRYLLGKNAKLNSENDLKEQPLHLACLGNHLETVKLIISAVEAGNSTLTGTVRLLVNAKQVNWQTPLFYAAKSSENTSKVIDALLENDADVFQVDKSDKQAVHEAVISRNINVLKHLLRYGGDAARKAKCCGSKTISHLAAEYNFPEFLDLELDLFDSSALCTAAANGSLDFAKKALSLNLMVVDQLCPYYRGGVGSTLHVATFHRQEQYVEFLLENDADVTEQDTLGATPLHALAVSSLSSTLSSSLNDSVERIGDLFLERNTFLAAGCDFTGKTPFHYSAIASSIEVADLLIRKWKANPSTTDNNGYTAFHLATSPRFLDFLMKLQNLAVGIDDHSNPSKDNFSAGSLTPIHVAIRDRKPLDVLTFLKDHGANVKAVNEAGQNVLHIAVESSNLEALGILMKESPSLAFEPDKASGLTPFTTAVKLGNVEALNMFLSSANNKSLLLKTVVTKSSDSPLHIAARFDKMNVVKLLIENGINVSATNSAGKTALHEAVTKENIQLVKLLINSAKNSSNSLVSQPDRHGRNPIHLSTRSNIVNVEMANVMLNSISSEVVGEVLNREDSFGETPLHRAVSHESVDVLKLFLLKHNGTGCRKPSSRSQSPFQLAEKYGYEHISEVMINSQKCYLPQQSKCTPTPNVRLIGKDGLVKFYFKEKWVNICPANLNLVVSNIICRSLCRTFVMQNFLPEVTLEDDTAETDKGSEANEKFISMSDCKGPENKLEECGSISQNSGDYETICRDAYYGKIGVMCD